jgi:hypothetical protein
MLRNSLHENYCSAKWLAIRFEAGILRMWDLDGGAWLPAERVARACENYLTAREDRIASEREAMIEKKMLTRRAFFGRRYTREEAVAALKQDNDDYRLVYILGARNADRVSDLCKLAKVAGEKVWVNIELFSVISRKYGETA